MTSLKLFWNSKLVLTPFVSSALVWINLLNQNNQHLEQMGLNKCSCCFWPQQSVRLWLCCTCLEDVLCRVWSIHPFLGMFSLGCNSLELSMTCIFLPCVQIDVDSPGLPCPRRGQKGCRCHFFVHELPLVSLGSSLGMFQFWAVPVLQVLWHLPSTNCKVYLPFQLRLVIQNPLPQCSVARWQCHLSHPALSRFLSLAPAGPHLLPCVEVSVESPHGGSASETQKNNSRNMRMQKRSS